MTAGEQFRKAVLSDYTVEDAVALKRLDSICQTIDELEAFEKALADKGPVVTGARQQQIANPAASLVRAHRALLDKLLDSAFKEDESASDRAKRAVRTRWKGKQ